MEFLRMDNPAVGQGGADPRYCTASCFRGCDATVVARVVGAPGGTIRQALFGRGDSAIAEGGTLVSDEVAHTIRDRQFHAKVARGYDRGIGRTAG